MRPNILEKMRCSSIQPTGLLAEFVASVWLYEGRVVHSTERILPSASMQLLVNLRDDEMRWSDGPEFGRTHALSGAALGGAFARPFAIDTAQQESITGVVFHPGGARAFFDVAMHELSHQHLNLAELGWGNLRDLLVRAHDQRNVLRTWVDFLGARCRPITQRRMRAACARLEYGDTVQGAADALGVSVRTLRNDVREGTGLSPKDFARVRRLQRLLQGMRKRRDLPWAARALHSGYFDQAHMIHEFQALTGLKPTQYFARSPDDWNHVVLDP